MRQNGSHAPSLMPITLLTRAPSGAAAKPRASRAPWRARCSLPAPWCCLGATRKELTPRSWEQYPSVGVRGPRHRGCTQPHPTVLPGHSRPRLACADRIRPVDKHSPVGSGHPPGPLSEDTAGSNLPVLLYFPLGFQLCRRSPASVWRDGLPFHHGRVRHRPGATRSAVPQGCQLLSLVTALRGAGGPRGEPGAGGLRTAWWLPA